MSNPAVQLQRQQSIMGALVYDDHPENSKYMYQGYTTNNPSYKEYKTYYPVNKDWQPNSYNDFNIPTYCDKLGMIQLVWRQGALTDTGGSSGSYAPRFADFFPLSLIERVEVLYGNNIVFTHRPHKKFYRIAKHFTEETRNIKAAELAGLLTPAARYSLAQSEQYIIYDLDFPFCMSPDRFMEVRALACEPVIRVYWRDLPSVVQTNGTNPISTITDLKMIGFQVHVLPVEKDLFILQTETENGIVRLQEETRVDISPSNAMMGTTGAGFSGVFQYPLKNYKTDIRFLAFWIQPAANLARNMANNQRWETGTFLQCRRFRLITGSSEEIIPWIDGPFNQLRMHDQYYFSPAQTWPIYFYTWDDTPMDELNGDGAYNFQALQDPMLEIDMGTTYTNSTNGPYNITVIRSIFNMWQMIKGDLSTQFQY
jgi:hypothetical protein